MSRESLLESKIIAHCKQRGILCYKFSSPARRGVPDRQMIHNGKVLFLELKALGKEPDTLQRRELKRLQDQGMTATWCDNYEDAVQIIDDHFIFDGV